MTVVMTKRAQAQIDHQFAYSVKNYGTKVAGRTFARLHGFIFETLASHPKIGRKARNGDHRECWVPRTPFLIIYQAGEATDVLTVLAVFHYAQDRDDFDPDGDTE